MDDFKERLDKVFCEAITQLKGEIFRSAQANGFHVYTTAIPAAMEATEPEVIIVYEVDSGSLGSREEPPYKATIGFVEAWLEIGDDQYVEYDVEKLESSMFEGLEEAIFQAEADRVDRR